MIAILEVRPGVAVRLSAAAVELLPVGVEGAHLRALGARVGVVARRGRGEERQRVLGADHEVGQLLGGYAGAAELLAVPRCGERVAERQCVALAAGHRLVREGLAAALTLDVVGQHHVAALGEVLGQPAVHPLAALHRALGDHDTGERPAEHLAGVRVARSRLGAVDGAVQQGAVAVGEGDPLAEAAGAVPAHPQWVADVPAREHPAGCHGDPGGRGGLLHQLRGLVGRSGEGERGRGRPGSAAARPDR